jgi:hypothetical protein
MIAPGVIGIPSQEQTKNKKKSAKLDKFVAHGQENHHVLIWDGAVLLRSLFALPEARVFPVQIKNTLHSCGGGGGCANLSCAHSRRPARHCVYLLIICAPAAAELRLPNLISCKRHQALLPLRNNATLMFQSYDLHISAELVPTSTFHL